MKYFLILGIVILVSGCVDVIPATNTENTHHEMITYYPSSVDIVRGTYNSGTLDSLKYVDTDFYSVQEVSGAPGYDIRFNFTGITKFNAFMKLSSYSGSTLHYKTTELYDCANHRWDVYDSNSGDFNFVSSYFPITNYSKYICGGLVQGRVYHPPSGSGAHYIQINKWVLMET